MRGLSSPGRAWTPDRCNSERLECRSAISCLMGAMLTKAGRNVQPPPCSRGMPDCFEPLSQCPLDVAQPRSGGGQQFGPAFDEIRTSQRRNTEVRLTHRWREMDSNIRFRAEETAIFEPPRIERASFSTLQIPTASSPSPQSRNSSSSSQDPDQAANESLLSYQRVPFGRERKA